MVEAQWAAEENRYTRFVTEQPPYSILVRGMEEDVLPTVQRYGMGTLVYSPLAGGRLSGKWRKGVAPTATSSARPTARFDMSTPANQRKLDIVADLILSADILDRIDEIVAPGVTINPDDNSYRAHELLAAARRR
ncbi:aldo/keto reductase [Mycolicibacterium iranicum]|uniref:aldo/keto reductase n=1 Tax=Mycolicibacterium iranicum TaxID=912594 RepID=UPI002E0D6186